MLVPAHVKKNKELSKRGAVVRHKYKRGGGGILTDIAKKLIKEAVDGATQSTLVKKAANAVVDGAADALKTTTQKGIESMVKNRARSKEQDRKITSVIERFGKGIVKD